MGSRRLAVAAVVAGWAVLTLLASGCGFSKTGANGSNGQAGETAVVSPSPPPSPVEMVELRVYFGDPQLERLVERSVAVKKADTPTLVRRALSEMASSPGDGSVALTKALEVRSVSLADGVLRIDVRIREEGRLGSPGELLLVEALKRTFFQFDDVRSVEMTVDGRRAESLMGHVELPYPMVRG